MARARRRPREEEEKEILFLESDQELMGYCFILAGLVDPATKRGDVDAALEVADALFAGVLERMEVDPDPDPE